MTPETGTPETVAILYVNAKGNIGDFAILHAMLCHIRASGAPSIVDIYIHSSLPFDERRWKAFLATSPLPVRIKGNAIYRKKAPSFVTMVRNTRARSMAHLAQELWLKRLARQEARKLPQYGRVFVAGGHQWNGYAGKSMLALISAISQRGMVAKAFSFSVSERIVSFSTSAFLSSCLGSLDQPIKVRNRRSVQILGKIGLAAQFEPDCAYSLVEEIAQISAKQGRSQNRIILSVTSRSKAGAEQISTFLERCKERDIPIKLMTTCALEDEALYRKLCAKLELEYIAPVTWQEAVAEMKSSDLVITNRLHAIILGSVGGVPILPLADREKIQCYVADSSPAGIHIDRLSNVDEDVILRARQLGNQKLLAS